jgi:hypothetical protein
MSKKNVINKIPLNINKILTYIVILKKAFWFILVQASKVIKKVLLDLIFSVNKSFIYCNFLLYFKVNLFVINFEYKAGMFLKKIS